MQIQKHLFRIAQRSNKLSRAQTCWKVIYTSMLLIGLVSLWLFLYGEVSLKSSQTQLTSCFVKNNFVLQPDQLAIIYTDRADTLMKKVQNIQTEFKQNKLCSIYKNLDFTNITDDGQLLITGLLTIYKMEKKERQLLKFDNYTVILKNRSYFKDFIYGVATLVANEIIRVVDQKKLNTLINSQQIYVKSTTAKFHGYNNFHDQDLLNKMLGILQTLFSYAVASVTTSLYIYVTIIASPAVILLILRLTPYARTQGYFQAFKSFPWIGMHSMILRASNYPMVKMNYIGVCWSLIIYFCIMYLGYYTVILDLTNLFFDMPMQSNVGEALFGYFAIIEFLALVFMRTRPFIKFFPLINSLIVFSYMLYCKFSHFGFKLLAGISMNTLCIALFSWMMINLEIPAQKTWQPEHEFVPTIKQPRGGLIPTFNLNWINGLPQQWTMLMPLVGQENFSKKQMSFVNQQYQELNQYLIQH